MTAEFQKSKAKTVTCCSADTATELAHQTDDLELQRHAEELLRSGRPSEDGDADYVLSIPSIHCGRCISALENAIGPLDGVEQARVNLTLRRLTIRAKSDLQTAGLILKTLEQTGYPGTPVDLGDLSDLAQERTLGDLVKAMAVAGFAAGNIMLLSVSVWSGAEGQTRDFFHLISALIAIPTVAYSGRVFFRSAWTALSGRRLNMDVPISLAVLLALGMSVAEALTGGEETYFDAAVMLLFFLLIGRFLDFRMRDRARNAVVGLSRLAVKSALRLNQDGSTSPIPVSDIETGMVLRVLPGERIPADGEIIEGTTDLDRSLVTGESLPVPAAVGTRVEAGTLNLNGTLSMRATASADASFLAEVGRMMEAAERGRGRYIRVADRMASLYAPVVHLLAGLAFIGWMIGTGGDWHHATMIAIAVLIITCPCALGLAVPVVHVIGAGRLFRAGILMKDGSALERLAEINHAVFDKTGTLTSGVPVATLQMQQPLSLMHQRDVDTARALGALSTHPASRAVAKLPPLTSAQPPAVSAVQEFPGKGVQALCDGQTVRLGRPQWVSEIADSTAPTGATDGRVHFARAGSAALSFALTETLREQAADTIAALKKAGVSTELLSGDNTDAVARMAKTLSLEEWRGEQSPAEKIERIESLRGDQHKVLMVGDGLNDAPALAAGHVSMAPATASDVGRMAADFVLTRQNLTGVEEAHRVALKARTLVRQNFGLAIAYNCIAVPLALAGIVTPLFAAIAMSASSIIVIGNSLRLARERRPPAVQKTITPLTQQRGQREATPVLPSYSVS